STKASHDTLQDILPLYWKSYRIKGRIDTLRPTGILENHLLPFFGDRPLASLSAEDGLNYVVSRQAAGAAAGTIRREWQVLTRLLNLAVRYDKLDKNRLREVDLPDAAKRDRVATLDELLAIRKADGVYLSELWRITMVALNTGLR